MRRVLPLVLLVVWAGCAQNPNPRHQYAVGSQVVAQSLFALQDAELAAFVAKKITPSQHQMFNQHLFVALNAGKDFNTVVRTWQPGQPPPPQLETLKQALFQLSAELTGWPPDVKTQLLATLNATYDAIMAVLLARGGV